MEAMPDRIAKLPRDGRGYPVPWFVAWIETPEGQRPEFRAMDARKWRLAVQSRVCWVCGEPLGRWLAFVLGPMCVITRTTSEPACHRLCAEWSLRNCPFLSNPRAVRRDDHLPPDVEQPAGVMLSRNPGVTALYITRTFETFAAAPGEGQRLITVGEPETVTWWCEGRPATRDEVLASIDGGLPALLVLARTDGPFAVEALDRHVTRAARWLPAREPEGVR